MVFHIGFGKCYGFERYIIKPFEKNMIHTFGVECNGIHCIVRILFLNSEFASFHF